MRSSFLSANADKVGRSISIWRYRELLRNLVLRNLRVKYQRSVLGFFWTSLNPLLTVAVLIAVFTYVVRIAVQDYWAFLISGYFGDCSINTGFIRAQHRLNEAYSGSRGGLGLSFAEHIKDYIALE